MQVQTALSRFHSSGKGFLHAPKETHPEVGKGQFPQVERDY